MLPMIRRLKAHLRAAEARSMTGPAAPKFGSAQERDAALADIDQRRTLNVVRVTLGGVG